jgi:hypothetical protein
MFFSFAIMRTDDVIWSLDYVKVAKGVNLLVMLPLNSLLRLQSPIRRPCHITMDSTKFGDLPYYRFFIKNSKRMHQMIQLISNFLTRKSCFPLCNYIFIMSIWWNKFMWKFQSFKILRHRVKREWYLLNHLSSFSCALGSKNLALDVGHMCQKLPCKKTC